MARKTIVINIRLMNSKAEEVERLKEKYKFTHKEVYLKGLEAIRGEK